MTTARKATKQEQPKRLLLVQNESAPAGEPVVLANWYANTAAPSVGELIAYLQQFHHAERVSMEPEPEPKRYGSEIDNIIAGFGDGDRFTYLPERSEWRALGQPYEVEEANKPLYVALTVARGEGGVRRAMRLTRRNFDHFHRIEEEA